MTPIRFVCCLMSLLFCVSANARKDTGSPRMPFAFVENRGQADGRVLYLGMGPAFKARFEARTLFLQQGQTAVRITFAGSAAQGGPDPIVTAANPIGAHANFLYGNDRRHWQTDLALFGT